MLFNVSVYHFNNNNKDYRKLGFDNVELIPGLEYYPVAKFKVEAGDKIDALNKVWERTQNINDSWHPQRIRSSMTGDVFGVAKYPKEFYDFYLVDNFGWKEVDNMTFKNNQRLHSAIDTFESKEIVECKIKEKTMNKETIEIKEEFQIPGTEIILEAGDKVKILNEASSKYRKEIEQIELYLGYETGIKAWLKGISVYDGFQWASDMENKYPGANVNIHKNMDREDIFDYVEELKGFLSLKDIFNEMYYNVEDRVAEYLFHSILNDYEASGGMYESKKLKEERNILFDLFPIKSISDLPEVSPEFKEILVDLKAEAWFTITSPLDAPRLGYFQFGIVSDDNLYEVEYGINGKGTADAGKFVVVRHGTAYRF